MKFKEDAEATATDDFWYDLFEGGRLRPIMYVEDREEMTRLETARRLLMEYKRELIDSCLVEYM